MKKYPLWRTSKEEHLWALTLLGAKWEIKRCLKSLEDIQDINQQVESELESKTYKALIYLCQQMNFLVLEPVQIQVN